MQSYSFCSAMRNFSSDISTFIVMFVCIISALYSDRYVPFRFSFRQSYLDFRVQCSFEEFGIAGVLAKL